MSDGAKLEAALAEAMRVGIAEASRRHGMPASLLRYHVKRRGLKPPRFRSGGRRATKNYDERLLLLCWLCRGYPLSLRQIATGCRISHQRVDQIYKQALRKVRGTLREEIGEDFWDTLKC